jgi:hypothetical protein
MKRDYDVKVRVRELKLGDLVYQLDTATVKGEAPLLLVISCPLNHLLTQFLGPLWNLAVMT